MTAPAMTEKELRQTKEEIRDLARAKGVELMGVADLAPFLEPGADIPEGAGRFLEPYSRAVVLGIPWGVDSGRRLLANTLDAPGPFHKLPSVGQRRSGSGYPRRRRALPQGAAGPGLAKGLGQTGRAGLAGQVAPHNQPKPRPAP